MTELKNEPSAQGLMNLQVQNTQTKQQINQKDNENKMHQANTPHRYIQDDPLRGISKNIF